MSLPSESDPSLPPPSTTVSSWIITTFSQVTAFCPHPPLVCWVCSQKNPVNTLARAGSCSGFYLTQGEIQVLQWPLRSRIHLLDHSYCLPSSNSTPKHTAFLTICRRLGLLSTCQSLHLLFLLSGTLFPQIPRWPSSHLLQGFPHTLPSLRGPRCPPTRLCFSPLLITVTSGATDIFVQFVAYPPPLECEPLRQELCLIHCCVPVPGTL